MENHMAEQTHPQTGGTDTRAESTEPTSFLTRRRLMKGTAGVVGAGALAGLGLWYGTQPALAASTFEESADGEVTVTTNAGEVMDVRVAPVFTLDWADFGGGVSGFDFDIEATVGQATETIYSETGVADATAGTIASFGGDSLGSYDGMATISCEETSIIGSTITTDSFPTNVSQGSSQSQPVTLSLTPSGTTNIGGSSVSAEPSTLSFTITVVNPEGAVTATIESSNAEADGADSANETGTTPA
jgi:hypothetical protein